MSIRVTVSGPGVTLLKTLPKQLAFVASQTINSCAYEGQKEVTRSGGGLDSNLIVRGPWWKPGTRYGINVRRSNKTNLESSIWTNADFLLETEGHAQGIRTPERGRRHLTVPVTQPGGRIEARQGGSVRGKMRRSEKAKALLANPVSRAFKVTTKSGHTLVLQRVGGRGGRGGKTSKVKTLYIFKTQVKVPKTSGFVEPAVATITRVLPGVWDSHLRKAVATIKP